MFANKIRIGQPTLVRKLNKFINEKDKIGHFWIKRLL